VLNHHSITLIFLFINFNLLATSAGAATGTVVSTIDAAGYTYVEADTGNEKIWLAGPKTAITQGRSINLDTSNQMKNFHSKSLNRDFSVVYFVNKFSGSAVQNLANTPSATGLAVGHKIPTKTVTLDQPVERAKDGKTIAEIITAKKELSGKTVKVRGKITKYTANIMNKNWIHMIDGSSNSDLVVITSDVAKVGQTAVIEGTIVLDKDFGYGYFYELLVENARTTVE
jgi:hypothetical protein